MPTRKIGSTTAQVTTSTRIDGRRSAARSVKGTTSSLTCGRHIADSVSRNPTCTTSHAPSAVPNPPAGRLVGRQPARPRRQGDHEHDDHGGDDDRVALDERRDHAPQRLADGVAARLRGGSAPTGRRPASSPRVPRARAARRPRRSPTVTTVAVSPSCEQHEPDRRPPPEPPAASPSRPHPRGVRSSGATPSTDARGTTNATATAATANAIAGPSPLMPVVTRKSEPLVVASAAAITPARRSATRTGLQVDDDRDGDAGHEREQPRCVQVRQADQVGDVEQRVVQRTLRREDVAVGPGAVTQRDGGGAVHAVVEAEVPRREHRREPERPPRRATATGGRSGRTDPSRPDLGGGVRHVTTLTTFRFDPRVRA